MPLPPRLLQGEKLSVLECLYEVVQGRKQAVE